MRIVPAGERTPHREESLFSDTPSAGREQNSELARSSNLTRSHEVSRGLMTQMQCMILSTDFSKSIAKL